MFYLIKLTPEPEIVMSLPAVLISGVHSESSHFMSVFSQLFVAGHAVSVDDVDYRVLRANPHLLLDQSHHAVLQRRRCDNGPQFHFPYKMVGCTYIVYV